MTPRDFMTEVVVPDIDAFKHDRAVERRAMAAINSVDALAARIFAELGHIAGLTVQWKDDTTYRDYLAKKHADFALARDLAKGLKHVKLVRGTPLIDGAASISSRATGFGELPYGEGGYGGPEEVVVELKDGSTRSVDAVLDAALTVLQSEMQSYGI